MERDNAQLGLKLMLHSTCQHTFMMRVVKMVSRSTTTVPPPVKRLITPRPLLWASFGLISSGTFLQQPAPLCLGNCNFTI